MNGPTPRNNCCGSKLPSYLGFAILGLVNIIVPFIVHSANYLITPYPRWIVIFIEALPALAAKLLAPHLLHIVPYWMRPLSIGSCWIIVALIIKTTPPNFPPPGRIFTSTLASAAAATMEVSFLGMTRYYGRAGLAGWGAGVGVGAMVCAMLPFVLTAWMEPFLRSFIDCIYALTGAMLVAFFVVLPGAPVNYPHARHCRGKDDIEDLPEGASLLVRDPVEELSRILSTKNRVNLLKTTILPFMAPLFLASAAQAAVSPSISRALPHSSALQSNFSFFTSYGFAFPLGGFISRIFTPLFRLRSARAPFMILGLLAAVFLVSATLFLFSSYVLVSLLEFCAGLGGGAVYMIVFDRVLEEKFLEPGINREFCLQVVGAGETAGTMVGGLLGTMLKATLCSWLTGAAERWCQTSR